MSFDHISTETMQQDLESTRLEIGALRELRDTLLNTAKVFEHEPGFAAQLDQWRYVVEKGISEGEQLEAMINLLLTARGVAQGNTSDVTIPTQG